MIRKDTMENKKTYGYIYKITHIPSGRYYIGQHKSETFDKNYWGSGTIIKSLHRKHPDEEFKREVLVWVYSEKDLDVYEEKFVTKDTLNDPKCINLKTGGDRPVHTEESNRRLAKALKGNKNACNMPEESRRKCNKNLVKGRGRKLTEEEIRKMNEKRRPKVGWHHSEETRRKISEANYRRTEEQMKYIRAKIVESNKKRTGEKRSEEYKKNMSEMKKRWWAERKRQNI